MADRLSEFLRAAERYLRANEVDRIRARIEDWSPDEQEEATKLLLWWFSLADAGRSPEEVEQAIIGYLVERYERWLRAVDSAVQEECRRHPPRGLAKAWGDPCLPMFRSKSSYGHEQIMWFRTRLNLYSSLRGGSFRNPPHVQLLDWYDEYRFRKNVLRQMTAQAIPFAIVGAIGRVGAWGGAASLAISRRSQLEGAGHAPTQGGTKSLPGPEPGSEGQVRSAVRAARHPRIPETGDGAKSGATRIDGMLGAARPADPRTLAQRFASRLQASGRRLVVNIGGTGEVERGTLREL